jgi:hypothetical protein
MAVLSAVSWARADELIDLGSFIAGIEKGGLDEACRPKGPLAKFTGQLINRYSFDRSRHDPSRGVTIPKEFAAAIGTAQAENRKRDGYTAIRVPLVGLYRGLRTRELTVHTGHQNGISELRILFDNSRDEVESVLGPDLAPARRPLDFPRDVVSRGKRAELVCDNST